MTKFEECMLLLEIINVELDVTSKRRKILQFINENQEEYWLHIDTIRDMLDDLYSTIIDEVTLVNCAKENNIVTSKMNYEDIFKGVKNEMDFITKVKELFSIEQGYLQSLFFFALKTVKGMSTESIELVKMFINMYEAA